MSILAEIITSAEKVEIEDITTNLPRLKKTIENTKNEVINYIDTVYVKFKYSAQPEQNKILLNKALEVEKELVGLKENAEYIVKKDLPQKQEKLSNNIVELNSIQLTLNLVLHLQQCLKLLMLFDQNVEEKNYLKCIEVRKEIEEHINQLAVEEKIDVLEDFTISIENAYFLLLNKLNTVFSDNIQLSQISEKNIYKIQIKHKNEEFETALLAMYSDTQDIYQLHEVIKFLWNNVFTHVVDHYTDIKISESEEYAVLELTVLKDNNKPLYTQVFSSIKNVLSFLASHLDYKLEGELTLIEYMGISIRDNLSELIIKHCLQDTIPSTAENLENYKEVIENTNIFENYLREVKLFTENTTSLIDYANNIDIHFINKKCQEYMLTAEALMKKDLHDMIELGEPFNPDNPLSAVDHFLQCSVSKSAIEIINLAETILAGSLSASDVCAGRLLSTIQNIFTKYCLFVPIVHKNLLQTIPQQVALFHNNCIYMSFTLLKWDHEYCSKLGHIVSYCNFDDQVFKLRNIATEYFANYVDGQITQLHDIMKQAFPSGSINENLEAGTEKCVRQCLRQQELLKTVWHKVLSYTVYNKTMGTIFDAFCNNIINCILIYEDISVAAAEQIVELFKLILNRGPKLFSDSKEVSIYVSSWYKLNEMNFILGANLLEINDRWADGKGPLALQYTPKEIKQLIRALFQNTDRRAAVLSKIQDVSL